MAVHLRPFNPDTDTSRVAELINAVAPQQLPCETLAALLTDRVPGRVHLRTVAVDGSGRIIGTGEVGHDPWMLPGRFWIDIIVAPDARQRGIGSMLGDDLVAFAWELGATSLVAPLRPHQPGGRRFVEHRGFIAHGALATLDLAAYLTERRDRHGSPGVDLGVTLIPTQAELDAHAAEHGLFELTITSLEESACHARACRPRGEACWCVYAAS